jgi:hypothetical protein
MRSVFYYIAENNGNGRMVMGAGWHEQTKIPAAVSSPLTRTYHRKPFGQLRAKLLI